MLFCVGKRKRNLAAAPFWMCYIASVVAVQPVKDGRVSVAKETDELNCLLEITLFMLIAVN